MNDQLLFGAAVVPTIVGLTEVYKQAGLPAQFAPVLAVLLGILAGLAQLQAGNWPWVQAVVIGAALGLSAVGLYSASTKPLTAIFRPVQSPPVQQVEKTEILRPAATVLHSDPPTGAIVDAPHS